MTFEAKPNDPPELHEKAAAMKRLRDEKPVFHGLRKNAINTLLKAGCTEAETGSVVEMSEQMVRHYSKDVNKRLLILNAMKKVEDCWPEARQRVFGENT